MTDLELDTTRPLPIVHAVLRARDAAGEPPTSIVPGSVVAGRYRLVAMCGSERHVQFWQGIETITGRPVGISLVDVDGALPVERVNEILSRTVRLRGLDVCGVAKIIEVLHTSDLGVVVGEWVPGGTLREIADTSPAPTAVAAALESLIVAADEAHRAGLTLNITHPGRIRISTDGHAVLAFAATMPETTAHDDLRGIGGALYSLLTGRWPAQNPMPSGWTAADLDEAGQPKEPVAIDRHIPFLISSAAMGLLRPESGVADAATLLTLLRLARETTKCVEQQPNSHINVMPALPPPRPGAYATFRNVDTAAQVKQVRRQFLNTMLVAAAAIIFIAVTSLGATLNRVLGETDRTAAMDADRLGLSPSTAVPVVPPSAPHVADRATSEAPVIPVKAAVFSPGGSPDNPQDAGKAIDHDAATAWSTDRYYDAAPFPKFKQGLGLVLALPQPTALTSLTIKLKSTGTVVQIRSASTDSPKALADTTELSAPTPLQPGDNRIQLAGQPVVAAVIVWISTLGSTDGNSRAEISELSLFTTARA